MSDYTYKPQQVDYLGFLEAQLRDLQGIDRLAYELIQNADDVQAQNGGSPPTELIFDVADDALVVQNDGVFRPVDFQRLQSIAGGGKRAEAGTTGAFGLGFIAVYQVTDAPQIFSNNLHWTIHPDAPPDRRIREREVQTGGTRFVLPWAFDGASTVRRALRIEAIDPAQLDAFARELAAAIGLAALFLKQLRLLEVRRNGIVVRRLQRDAGERRVVLTEADGRSATWMLFSGDFSSHAARLRQEYAWQIEETRHALVMLAVASNALPSQGRLFAVLPTDSTMPLPVHLNADFFPTTDRRRIHFDDGYQARWNRQAITAAARVLAENLHEVRPALQPQDFWLLLQRAFDTEQATARQELPAPFAAFWQSLAPQLSDSPVVYTAGGDWVPPARARIVSSNIPNGETAPAGPLLQALGIAIVHPRLRPYFPLLRRPEIDVRNLALSDLAAALHQQNLAPQTPLALAPVPLDALDAWQQLWQLIDDLLIPLPRHEQRQTVLRRLGDVPLVLDDMMSLSPLRRVYRGDAEAKALFPDVSWLHDMLDEDRFPARLVSQFGVRQAVEYLADQTPEQLQEAWRMGRLDLPRLFRWFEARQIEIFADDPALQREIRNLPLVPISGELRPLAHLYIPGGFEDPLHLAGVLDLETIGGRRQFLQDLGLQELDFETYLHTHIPRVLSQNPDLPSDARHRLLQLLAERLGQFRDDLRLCQELSRLPLIPCMDGSFRAATEVYASREAAALLGARVHIAEPLTSQALQALHRWLGVRHEPAAADLLRLLLEISARQIASHEPLTKADLATVLQCWHHLDRLYQQEKLSAAQLAQLRARPTLPNRARAMSQPPLLLFVDQPDLAPRFAPSGEIDTVSLLPDDQLLPLMQAAGVRHFSDAVRLEITAEQEAAPNPEIARRLQQRHPLIARLLHAESSTAPDSAPLRFLDNLRVLQLPNLQTRYRLQLGPHNFESQPLAQSATLVANQNVLYVDAREQPPPWSAIARELATAIKDSAAAEPGAAGSTAASLALGIREVLSAPTTTAAAQILDELGYP